MIFPLISLTNISRKQRFKADLSICWLVLVFISSTWASTLGLAQSSDAVDDSPGQSSISELILQCKELEDKDPAAAITLANTLLSELQSQKDTVNYGHALGCLGWAQVTQNQLALARSVALKIEQLVTESGETSIDSIQLSRRAGGIFHRMGDRISASENYNVAMQQAETLAVVAEQIPILVNLGVLNSELRAHKQAIENYYLALDLMQDSEDFRYQPPVLFNLATTLNGQKRFTEGLKLFKQVEKMITEQWPPGRVSQVYHGLAAAHSALDDLVLAKDYAEKALKILEDSAQINAGYYNLKSVLANVYSRQGADEQATRFANEAKAFYLNPVNQADVLGSANPLSSLASTYERLGLLSQSIKLHKAAKDVEQAMQDSFNQEVMVQMQDRMNDNQAREAQVLFKNKQISIEIEKKEAEFKRKIWRLISMAAIFVLLMFLVWQNITNRKLKKMAMTDTLTQLGNRRAIMSWLARHKIPKEPNNRLLWLMDLDRFKAVNDEHDHDVGDFALQKIAQALLSLGNSKRFVGRWGGEEFMLITDDLTKAQRKGFSEVLLNTIRQTRIQTGAVDLHLTASVGVSRITDQSPTAWTQAMQQADQALYAAKHGGRNCVVSVPDAGYNNNHVTS